MPETIVPRSKSPSPCAQGEVGVMVVQAGGEGSRRHRSPRPGASEVHLQHLQHLCHRQSSPGIPDPSNVRRRVPMRSGTRSLDATPPPPGSTAGYPRRGAFWGARAGGEGELITRIPHGARVAWRCWWTRHHQPDRIKKPTRVSSIEKPSERAAEGVPVEMAADGALIER